ncbi:MAG: molybdenum cofactor biosynthesis protein [Actinobacteria bacterium HGW-Actinobacteria-7]|nr:MAG: molybdenum cofactor biosynthesis protein [Actinobacteria bacterium HGW-Actinobacteria-7]
MSELRIAILTCSDTRSPAEDTAGQALKELSTARGWSVVEYRVCPDEHDVIASALVEMADVFCADVVFTCGGTGLGPRDVTPEATLSVAGRAVPGIAEHIRAESLRVTKRAMLSRAVAAQRGKTLIINMPGSLKAATETFSFVADQLEHARDMAAGGGHG